MGRLRVRHRTSYRYGAMMSSGVTLVRLRPRDTPHQRVVESRIVVDPEPGERDEWTDAFGNLVVLARAREPHDHLEVLAESVVDVADPVERGTGPPWEDVVAQLARDPIDPFVTACRLPSRHVPGHAPAAHQLGLDALRPGIGVVEGLRALSALIQEQFVFDPHSTDVSTPVEEVLAHRRGVCQDFAHVALAALRSVGLAARYVSGYLETEPPPGQPRFVGSDASHAWCSAFVPDLGWVDLDPTNGSLPTDRHVTTAWGRDYADVAPLRGVVLGPPAEQQLEVAVDVTPVMAPA
jgi:transglutaminase-like putative cysteine protease